MAGDSQKKANTETEFFTEYDEASQYEILEVVGMRSYGIVGAALDTKTGEKVAIKKINNVFEHVSDATRILREIKRLRLLRYPDVVEIKHIILPPSDHLTGSMDNLELLTEIGASRSSAFSFGVDEVISEDEDLDYDSEEDDLVIFEEKEDDDDDVISEMSNDWSHAETMQATHPVYFAKKISERNREQGGGGAVPSAIAPPRLSGDFTGHETTPGRQARGRAPLRWWPGDQPPPVAAGVK
ncbi:Mitogen-activated protein kinase 12 [Platanthera guangdongensis]|uniref:Mitogen-activated protein kinase 12 n=1 Tax=Platanthera guangdongensis TaxID=2320717 RepID=A0ABR2LJ42_9ASPA